MSAPFHLSAEEHIVKRYNRHWASLLPGAFIAGFLLLLLPLIPLGLAALGGVGGFGFGPAVSIFSLVLMLLIVIVVLMIAYVTWMIYQHNYMVVTNLNLIIVERKGLFHRRVVQFSLANLEDIKAHRSGILATVFDYGNVEIQTASEDDTKFEYAPNPAKVADEALHAHEQFMQKNEYGPGH